MSNPKFERPLSPFMMYRWQYSNTLSILHRVTGCALTAGLLLFVYWLVAVASGPEAYAEAQSVFAHPLTRVLLVGFSFAFFYHLLNGIRHLVWDAGYGFEKPRARATGWLVFLGAIVLTAILWVLVATGGAA
ncbi:succinate dehydrogenase, cytochrome b556 subunit [Steroidobacter sp. S1-65]|uniref:Succinate dehydrogenase cytochrome b556 subunit n=1 Tax=Steroidobacter gossypii TaxID=2805490 RepID=A0ABS1WVW0_9GAMM|nr:succinate dehydrogenase, cytochrome b556 subunit [Steroidobacter gossypii]MBM0105112.1 succinate dehydrogenase, cytochrome b556 subunit [Steroidobacter gossypii]